VNAVVTPYLHRDRRKLKQVEMARRNRRWSTLKAQDRQQRPGRRQFQRFLRTRKRRYPQSGAIESVGGASDSHDGENLIVWELGSEVARRAECDPYPAFGRSVRRSGLDWFQSLDAFATLLAPCAPGKAGINQRVKDPSVETGSTWKRPLAATNARPHGTESCVDCREAGCEA